ncbi:MAG TPA: flavodoxin domain-containing protein [Vicinamibacterales bacterium]|nr:flavodoxin domain-containing protein [Vicinamibacterales bacterium]
MKTAVFFATREGQACRVAEHISDTLREHGAIVDLFDVRNRREPVDWPAYQTAFVVASVHLGRHEKEMIRFVRSERPELERLGAAFVSLSLSQAGAQDERRSADDRRRASADVQGMIDAFVADTGWQPAHVLPAAGALAYRQYNLLVRMVMKRIARANGAPTDASRNDEFTDWPSVDRFVEAVTPPFATRPTGFADRRRAS